MARTKDTRPEWNNPTIVNEKGLFIECPIDVGGFDPLNDSYRMLGKTRFAEEPLYHRFRAREFEARADQLLEKAEEQRSHADWLIKIQSDPAAATQFRIEQLQKKIEREQKALEAQLETQQRLENGGSLVDVADEEEEI